MDQLWAPWRISYINGIDKQEKTKECVFCSKHASDDDRGSLLLHRGKSCIVIQNLYPYNNGHLMVLPYRHIADMCALKPEESSELFELLCLSKHILHESYHPDGFNIGINQGRAAGAGIDSHLHAHIVPRWSGDTNFMPVTGETKVLSQSLEATYDTLLPYFRSMAGSSSCS
jgi:ATP adenylyltransferase